MKKLLVVIMLLGGCGDEIVNEYYFNFCDEEFSAYNYCVQYEFYLGLSELEAAEDSCSTWNETYGRLTNEVNDYCRSLFVDGEDFGIEPGCAKSLEACWKPVRMDITKCEDTCGTIDGEGNEIAECWPLASLGSGCFDGCDGVAPWTRQGG